MSSVTLLTETKMDVLKFFFIFGLSILSNALAPVPVREIGFIYSEGSPNAKIKLDMYIDQVCPESKAAWPTILRVADHYGPQKLRLRTRVFSLPFLRNGYLASKVSYIVQKLSNTSMTYSYIGKVYSQYDSLNNAATTGQSNNQIIEKLIDLAAGMGLRKAEVSALFSNGSLEWAARVAWKHAATRRIFGVPTFFLNDVMVEAPYTWTVEDWQNLIDPMLGIEQKTTVIPTNRCGCVHPTSRMWAWLGVFLLCIKISQP